MPEFPRERSQPPLAEAVAHLATQLFSFRQSLLAVQLAAVVAQTPDV